MLYFDDDDDDDDDDLLPDGRFMDIVNEYASTCDGCADFVHHDLQVMDVSTQLGFCEKCIENGTAVKILGREIVYE